MKKFEGIRSSTEAPILIVAHSHGGNVACKALMTLPHCSILGVACFSTPFIIEEPVGNEEHIPFQSPGLTCVILGYLAWSPFTSPPWSQVLYAIAAFGLLCIFVATQIDDYTKGDQSLASWTDVKPTQFFIAGTAWDEAAAALIIHRILDGVLALSSKPIGLVGQAAILLLIGFGSVDTESFRHVYGSFVSATEGILKDVTPTAFIVACAVLGTPLLAGAIRLIAVFIGTIIDSLFFGPSWPWMALVRRITIRKTPTRNMHWRGYVPEGKGLVHGRLYQDEFVISELMQWARELVKR